MNALAADECRTVSRGLLGPLESMQRDAIVQSLLGLPRQQGQDSRITRVSRATIYRKIHQYGIITAAS